MICLCACECRDISGSVVPAPLSTGESDVRSILTHAGLDSASIDGLVDNRTTLAVIKSFEKGDRGAVIQYARDCGISPGDAQMFFTVVKGFWI